MHAGPIPLLAALLLLLATRPLYAAEEAGLQWVARPLNSSLTCPEVCRSSGLATARLPFRTSPVCMIVDHDVHATSRAYLGE